MVYVLQIIATRAGDADMVSLLVSVAESDVNKASYVARSRAIHWAASSDCDGGVECLQVLLAAGADVEARVASGRTPIMLAARAGHSQAVKQLLKHGTLQHFRSSLYVANLLPTFPNVLHSLPVEILFILHLIEINFF